MHELLAWYRVNKRDLPWRKTKNPYNIWLSEIIMQQTRIDQGLAYYLRFIERYPDVHQLANASEDEVLRLWQGLGYYSRARNLHYTAKYISEDLKGVFPDTYKELLKLKGVGDYTASAIASISYNQPEAVVDGNVYRVLARYLAIDAPINSTEGKKVFKAAATELLNTHDAGTHNEALMELGAVICTPRNPICDSCPLAESCIAFKDKRTDNFPVKLKGRKVSSRYLYFFICTDTESVYIQKREGNDIWKGLYQFPLVEKQVKYKTSQLAGIVNDIGINEINIQVQSVSKEYKHILSHQVLYARFIKVEFNELPAGKWGEKIKIKDLNVYALPRLLTRYLEENPIESR